MQQELGILRESVSDYKAPLLSPTLPASHLPPPPLSPSKHREEEQQRELEAQKAEKEKEIAKLRAQQERAKDKQAEKVSGPHSVGCETKRTCL